MRHIVFDYAVKFKCWKALHHKNEEIDEVFTLRITSSGFTHEIGGWLWRFAVCNALREKKALLQEKKFSLHRKKKAET